MSSGLARREYQRAWLNRPGVRDRQNALARARYATPEGKLREQTRERARRNLPARRARQKRYDVTFRYGITMERYDQLMAAGNPITGQPFTEEDRPHVDHDHTCCSGTRSCGQCIRGILPGRLNQALGLCADDPAVLRALADYLDRWVA